MVDHTICDNDKRVFLDEAFLSCHYDTSQRVMADQNLSVFDRGKADKLAKQNQQITLLLNIV